MAKACHSSDPLWHCHRVPSGEQVQRAASLLQLGLGVLAAPLQSGEVPLSYQEGAGRAGPALGGPSLSGSLSKSSHLTHSPGLAEHIGM